MRKVLFVIPDLLHGSTARQLTLLATGLPRDGFQPCVCVVGSVGAEADPLRKGGVRLEPLEWKHALDLAPFVRLRDLIHGWQPDVIHAWRLPALRLVALLRGWQKGRVLASRAFTDRDGGRPSWWDRRLLRWADAVVAGGAAEAARLRRLGVAENRIVLIPPGVEPPAQPALTRAEVYRRLHLPEDARLLAGAGPLERNRGFYDAVWTLDILQSSYPALHLVLTGDGPDRERLLRFARANQTLGRLHLAGGADGAVLGAAEVGWAPDRAPDDVTAVLEMMAAGLPVVASRLPLLAEVVRDGETGLLVRPGDRGGLARQTRRLLEDAGLRRRLGEAGRERVAGQFSLRHYVEQHVRLYEAGGGTG